MRLPKCLAALLVLSLVVGIHAQTLTNGTLYLQTLSANTTNSFTLSANTGDNLVVRVGLLSSSGFFNPWLRLYGPDGQLLGSADAGNGTAAEIALGATNSGTFTITVSDGGYGGFNGTGTYQLNYVKMPGTFVVAQGDDGGTITNGTLNSGTISAGDIDAWTFQAQTGDSVVVRVGLLSSSGFFNPWLRLYGPNGQLIGSSDAATDSATEIALTATNTGTFTVLVSDGGYGGLGGTGTYQLNILRLPGSFVVSPGHEGGSITNGTLNSGTISDGQLEAWSFQANNGDNLVVRVGLLSSSGFFNPWLRLYGPDGQLVGSSDPGTGAAAEIALSATNSGSFTIVISDGGYGGLGGTGTYQLNYLKFPGSFVVSPGQEGGAITNGTLNSGTISDGQLEAWSFSANNGESFVVRVGLLSSSAFFNPWLRLYGPDGQLVGSSDPGTGAAAELALSATNSGSFTIVISDGGYGGLGGTGTYQLNYVKIPGSLVVSPGQQGGAITNGTLNPGTISDGQLEAWAFQANNGDSVVVRAGLLSSSDFFNPWLRLYGPDGQLIAAVDSNTGVDAELALRATNSGTFTILVSDGGYGGYSGTGTYQLNFFKAPGTFAISQGDEGGALASGTTKGGTITVGDLDAWSFTATQGDFVSVSLAGTNFVPEARLYGSDGFLLATATSSLRYTTTNAGSFTVLVSAFSPGGVGPYGLRLADVPFSIAVPTNDTSGFGGWTTDGGVWIIGIPTASDGALQAHSPPTCAGTVLSDDYPNGANARLMSPPYVVPSLDQNPRFKFWQWYHTASSADYGQLQIRLNGGNWTNISEPITGISTNWTERFVDLRPYAGQTIQIAFHFVSGTGATAAGWYVDDVSFESGPMTFSNPESFEAGLGDWNTDNYLLWQIGTPLIGPPLTNNSRAHSGTNVAATVLNGNYAPNSTGRLISPVLTLPAAEPDSTLFLRFWQWYQYGSGDSAQVQLSQWTGTNWGPWSTLALAATNGTSTNWNQFQVDLSSYQGQKVQFGFLHTANNDNSVGAGWYLDDIGISSFTPTPLILGSTLTNRFASDGDRAYYVVQFPGGAHLQITLNELDGLGVNELYVRRGGLPSAGVYDYRFSNIGAANQSILISDAASGPWYILAYGNTVAGSGAFTIEATSLTGLVLSSLAPNRMGNVLPATIAINGAGFDDTAQAFLMSGASIVSTGSVAFVSSSLLQATFNVVGTPAGSYNVQISQGTSSASLPIQIVNGAVGKLQAQLITPGAVGRHVPSVLYVQYANIGDGPMPAPLIVVHGSEKSLMTLDPTLGALGLWTSAQPNGFNDTLEILASGNTPGVLQPGEKFTVPVMHDGLQRPWDLSAQVEFDLSIVEASDTNAVDWAGLENTLQPASVGSNAWHAVWANFTSQVGSTLGQYVGMLDKNASYLGGLGLKVTDVSDLLTFQLTQAEGLNPLSVLAGANDAQIRQPGLNLVFSRLYLQPIGSRYRQGPLGWGWTHNWEITLQQKSDGTISVTGPDGNPRVFQPDLRGGFFTEAGENARLSNLGASGWALREANGFQYSFLTNGLLDHVEDLNSNRITAAYSGGLLTSLTHSSGSSLRLNYSGGLLQSVTDPYGRITTYTYDGAQHLTSVTAYGTNVTAYSYSIGQGIAREHALTSVSYPGGTHDYFAFDIFGRLTSISHDNSAEPVFFSYDNAGTVNMSDAYSNTVSFRYDHRSQLARVDSAIAGTVSFGYNKSLDITSIQNSTGRSSTFSYNSQNNLIGIMNALGQKAVLIPTNNSRLSKVSDARLQPISFKFDARGNQTNIIYPDTSLEAYGFDAHGELVSFKNRRGQTITLVRDLAGRVIQKALPEGRTINSSYDGHGNLTNLTDSAQGTTSMQFDNRDLLTAITFPDGKGFLFQYDAAGRRTRRTGLDGYILNYFYDSAGRLQKLQDGNGRQIISYTYDAAGRITRADKGNGTWTTSDYTPMGRLAHVRNFGTNGNVLSQFDYSYDANGNRTSATSSTGTTSYTYDDIGQLTGVLLPGGRQISYAYDAAGNRTAVTDNGATTLYAANSLNEYTQAGSATFLYDADGNLTNRTDAGGTTTFAYNSEGRLVSINTPTNGTWQYTYDALGSRVSATHGAQTVHYLHDPFGLVDVVAEYDQTGALVARYDHALGLADRVDASGAAAFYDFDAMGNTAEMTSADGTVANHYEYDPYGVVISKNEAIPNPFAFGGLQGVMQDGNGTWSMRLRDYMPELGRFTAPDPAGWIRDNVNGYLYAENSPARYSDPSGAQPWFVHAAGILLGVTTEVGGYVVESGFNYLTEGKTPTWGGFIANVIGGAVKGEIAVVTKGQSLGPVGQATVGFYVNTLEARIQTWWDNEVPSTQNLIDIGINTGVGAFVELGEVAEAIVKKYSGNFAKGIQALRNILNGQGLIGKAFRQNSLNDFFKKITEEITKLDLFLAKLLFAHDPNGMVGPAGFGVPNYLGTNNTFSYQINFQNSSNATAPAQVVAITNAISTNLDLSTLEFTGVTFGDHFLTIPSGSQHYENTEHVNFNGTDFDVNIEASVDYATRQVRVTFDSIIPFTGLPPSIDTGFLPPEDGTGRGNGYVAYLIRPVAGLATGTEIRNIGRVSFDPLAGGPVFSTDLVDPTNPNSGTDTNRQALVTIDSTPPTSAVTSLSSVEATNSFAVSWSGSDTGSGVASFDIYVSTNNGPWNIWLAGTTNNSALFQGQPPNIYSFFSIAHDAAGNSEPLKSSPDTTTTVAPATTPVFLSAVRTGTQLTLTWSSIAGRQYQLQSVADLGSTAWSNLGPTITAGNSSVSASDSTIATGQRFYRVLLLP